MPSTEVLSHADALVYIAKSLVVYSSGHVRQPLSVVKCEVLHLLEGLELYSNYDNKTIK